MKSAYYVMPKDRVSNTNILQWTAKSTASIARKGYTIIKVTHGETVDERYRITIWYSGNIFQRIWRKLTQW